MWTPGVQNMKRFMICIIWPSFFPLVVHSAASQPGARWGVPVLLPRQMHAGVLPQQSPLHLRRFVSTNSIISFITYSSCSNGCLLWERGSWGQLPLGHSQGGCHQLAEYSVNIIIIFLIFSLIVFFISEKSPPPEIVLICVV